jgi:hypothetical protein
MGQLDDQLKSTYPQGRAWKSNLERMSTLKYLAEIPAPKPDKTIEERSMWNPLVGGMFLTYITYFANLEGGAANIDSFAQLRVVLHLFNALKERGAIQEGSYYLLDTLDNHFATCKAVWEGQKPKQGEFVKRFWIAYGMKVEVAQRIADDARRMITNAQPFDSRACQDLLRTRSGDSTRQMVPINAEDFSKSYRRICLRDFSDVQDK